MYLLVAGLLGIGFGPTSVALVTDRIFHDEQALRWALATVSVPAVLIAVWASWSGQAFYVRSRAAASPASAVAIAPPSVLSR